MVKQNQVKIFQAGILAGIVLLVLNSIEGWIFNSQYLNSDPALWKEMAGNWWLYLLAFNLVVGLILALVYGVLHDGIPDKGIKKGIQFAFWIWLVGSVPGLLMTIITMAVPAELVVIWIVSNLFNLLIAGVILGSVVKFKNV